ncbi:CBS domain-containing protein [Streptosporangium sp. NPDC048047]|uniref:CBS domain-containing protein n=1 Tax=unclassified Streptosporangium TaxID=2632669 RepID=UPI003426F437
MTMQVKDVMGKVAIAVRQDAPFAELVATMQRFKVGAVTVIDADRRPVGVVSDDDLLLKETTGNRYGTALFEGREQRRERRKAAGAVAGEIMTSPAITVTIGTPVRDAARLMHTVRIKQLPVIDPVTGRMVGTVHQRDLLKVFLRPRQDVRREVTDVLAGLGVPVEDVTVEVEAGVVTLTGEVPRSSQVAAASAAVHEVDGVVDVRGDLTYQTDDLLPVPPMY